MKNENDAEWDETLIAGLIVTHANLGDAFREAVLHVTGSGEFLQTLANENSGTEELTEQIRAALASLNGRECVVFVDFRAGSCASAAVLALGDFPNVRILSGVNLPMLLDFVLRRGDLALDRLVERLLLRGKTAVRKLGSHDSVKGKK